MPIDPDAALERVLSRGDEWQSWRALRLSGDDPGEVPKIPAQEELGGFLGPSGRTSPGATGEALCHLKLLGLEGSAAAVVAGDWLIDARTPAQAWLDSPDDVPGVLDAPAGARVWATASTVCGLLAVGRDPGGRALELLRGEVGVDGGFTGGAYPTFAAAGVWWQAFGPKAEETEWTLRWARESEEDWWGAWERATALTFWAAAGVPLEHVSVDRFVDRIQDEIPPDGWRDDLGLTLRTLEVLTYLGA